MDLLSCGFCSSGCPQSENQNDYIDKYLNLASELKELWNMTINVILIVIGTLEWVPKCLETGVEKLEISERIEIVPTTVSARVFKRLPKNWGDLLSLSLQWKTISKRWCEKLLRSKIIITIIFLKCNMEKWHSNLLLINEKNTFKTNNLNINNGIFQEDSLSPLLLFFFSFHCYLF